MTCPPFSPQSLEQMRRRYPEAVATIYQVRDGRIVSHPGVVPGCLPQHRFCFYSGLLVVVEHENIDGTDLVVFSTSMTPDSHAYQSSQRIMKASGVAAAVSWYSRLSVKSFQAISGDLREPVFYGTVGGDACVPAWLLPDREEDRDAVLRIVQERKG